MKDIVKFFVCYNSTFSLLLRYSTQLIKQKLQKNCRSSFEKNTCNFLTTFVYFIVLFLLLAAGTMMRAALGRSGFFDHCSATFTFLTVTVIHF